MEAYANGNAYFVGAEDAVYDAVTVLDANGHEVRRWGYFNDSKGVQKPGEKRSLKRKGSDLWPVHSPKGLGRQSRPQAHTADITRW